jgi:hypothetical protein
VIEAEDSVPIDTGTTRMIVVLAQAPTPCEHVYVDAEEVGQPVRV